MKLPKMTNKEVLIAFCNTLSDNEAKKAYDMLAEYYNIKRSVFKKYNEDGIEDSNGKVRLRKADYQRLIDMFGQPYVVSAIRELANYINYLEQNKEGNASYKSKLRKLATSSHYPLLKSEWIAQRVRKQKIKSEGYSNPYKETYEFYKISNQEEALTYLKSIPRAFWNNNKEVEYLLTQYPELVKEFE